MKAAWLTIVLLLLASLVEAQPVVVAAGAVSYSAAATAFTYHWTTQNNPGEELWVVAGQYGYATAAKSVSFGATGFQFLTVSAASGASTKESHQAWGLLNPAQSTAANIVVTFANSQPATVAVIELDNTNEVFPTNYSIFGSLSMFTTPLFNLNVQNNYSLCVNAVAWVAPSTPTGTISAHTAAFSSIAVTYTGASNSSPSEAIYGYTNPGTGSEPFAVTITQSVYVNDLYWEIDQANTPTPTWTPTRTPTWTPTPTPTWTPTATPTWTPTATPTWTPANTPAPTVTPLPGDGGLYVREQQKLHLSPPEQAPKTSLWPFW